MAQHLIREIDKLKKLLFSLCAVVEDSVNRAVRSIEKSDPKLAAEVVASDDDIDRMEIEVEEECLKILALHQPVAIDLRFIIACLKMNSDLERIGDLAVGIAERALQLAEVPVFRVPFDLGRMARLVQTMLKKCLDALVNLDIDLAREVRADDDEIDSLNREMYDLVTSAISKTPQHAASLILLLSVSRALERIGDHAANIAGDVIYMLAGEIIRHSRPPDASPDFDSACR